jgi:putative tryptophan/tyrosine transport system substrate-binding protein
MFGMKRREFITLLGGAAAAWPLAARAQQPERMRRIGVLMGYSESDAEAQAWIAIFLLGLKQLGWIEGRNIQFDYRWAGGNVERMESYAAELAAFNPDLVLAGSTPALAALWHQTRTIPIVFVNVADPVEQGFISTLAHPGRNITGFTSLEFSMGAKWVETLKEISPSLARIALLYNPETAPYFASFLPSIESAASSLSVKTLPTPVHSAAEIETAIKTVADRSSSGLIVVPSAFATIHRETIISRAAQFRLPAVYGFGYYAASGGLIAYGIDVLDMYRRASAYVDRILNGTNAGDLPVQAPNKFQLVINLKTAKAFGLDVPATLLARADEVIE